MKRNLKRTSKNKYQTVYILFKLKLIYTFSTLDLFPLFRINDLPDWVSVADRREYYTRALWPKGPNGQSMMPRTGLELGWVGQTHEPKAMGCCGDGHGRPLHFNSGNICICTHVHLHRVQGERRKLTIS
jgi:hypothetical protein